jgi:hypothetical protein
VFFVDGTTAATIRGDLESGIRSLDGHQHDTYEAALAFMSSSSPDIEWLYIIDNADDPDLDLTPYLPTCSDGTIIITSRNRKTRHLASTHHLELGPMLQREAIETLSRAAQKAMPFSDDELGQASVLVEELGCLPLAVVQAGIYISEMSSSGPNDVGFTFGQYISLFRRHREQLLRQKGQVALDKYPNGVYATLDLSYSRLSEPCRHFLHLCSFFRYTNIAVPMFLSAAQGQFEDGFVLLAREHGHKEVQNRLRQLFCSSGEWDELRFNNVLQSLSALSLVSISSIHDTILLRFHPLVHSYARDGLETEEQAIYKQMAITCISTSFAELPESVRRYVAPHCMLLMEQSGKESLHLNDLIRFGELMNAQAQYQTAEEVYRKILDDLESTQGYEYRNKIQVSSCLARSVWRQGRWKEAEKLEKELVFMYQDYFGPEHTDTMYIVSRLASTYEQQGKWKEAEALQKHVLTVFEKKFGPEHPNTIDASNNLSYSLCIQGKLEEAEALARHVLAMRQKLYGPDGRDTLETSSRLSHILLSQGKFHEAEILNREVLAGRSKILGPNHPDTILASSSLARVLFVQGRFEESEALGRETLVVQERILGKEHPWCIDIRHNYAYSIFSQGRAAEALPLSLQATQLAEKVLGPDHPSTQSNHQLLVNCYRALGDHVEATDLEEKVKGKQRLNGELFDPGMREACLTLSHR